MASYNAQNNALEKIPCRIFTDSFSASEWLAEKVVTLLALLIQKKGAAVLALPTGNTPIPFYAALCRWYQEGKIAVENIHIFLLDEYYGLEKTHPNSFYYFIQQHLLQHVPINPKQTHSLDGSVAPENIQEEILAYERKIKDLGGIDILLLGIGVNGHIGFNEPGAHIRTQTRHVFLENSTRIVNARAFKDPSEVPYTALSMGMDTFLRSRQIFLMAWGKGKAAAIQGTIEGKVSEDLPASALQLHPHTLFVLDEAAATQLTRFQAPWLGGRCRWDLKLMKKAVIQLALKCQKPILGLSTQDYLEHGLSELIAHKKDAYEVNLEVFYALRDSITGWPGGKPSPLPNHPERAHPYPKRVLIFSPHPDDDIISMGGTFMRLHEQGHEVYVAYQSSGNIAVTDEFALRSLDFANRFQGLFNLDQNKSQALMQETQAFFQEKKAAPTKDNADIRAIKGLIRRCEARATCRYVGIPETRIFFQNLPFYETGTIEKKPISSEDISQTITLLEQIKPHQIYCAGDLADPHGTHKTCLDIIFQAIEQLKSLRTPWLEDCRVWMYKGAWQEWDIADIEMAIPMSPEQVIKKRYGIFIHQSQKDDVPFQGGDTREFWQRAEDRNRNTAALYKALGLTEYAAMEAFVRWHF